VKQTVRRCGEDHVMRDGDARSSFAGPAWLRDIGTVAWMIVGIALAVIGAIWLLALTSTIVMPVITAFVIAAVGAPVVGTLARRRVPRAVGALIVFLTVVVIGVVIGALILGGITSQASDITPKLQSATQKIADTAKDVGVGDQTADSAKSDAQSTTTGAKKLLLNGVAHSLDALAGLAIFLSFTAIILFFLLKDGPTLRDAFERHIGVPRETAHIVVERMLSALRGYFAGVTIVAAFNAVVIGLGALIIGVPLPATIAIVTFVGGYIPYLGAWAAGAFAVLMALGGGGADAAIAMAIVALLGNGILQQVVQPFAMGSALDLHPIVVLVLTIGAGCLFGTVGLVLAAPVTSAIVKITADLRAAREGVTVGPDPPLAATAPG
jgi:putative heme transporter